MKTQLLKVMFLLSLISLTTSLKAQLSGTYTIGGITPTFATIQAACDSLNSVGVSGAVIMNIRDGSYNEEVTLDSVIGVTATNTITFQSESGDSSSVDWTSSATTFYSEASYLRLKNLSISAFSDAVVLFNGTDYNVIGCALYSTASNGIFFEGYGPLPLSNVIIENCTFSGRRGVTVSVDNLNQFSVSGTNMNTTTHCGYLNAFQSISNVNITNSSFNSINATSFEVYGSEILEKMHINNSYFHAVYDCINLYSDDIIDSIDIHDNAIKGSYDVYQYGSGILVHGTSSAVNISHVNISNNDIDSIGNLSIGISNHGYLNEVELTGNEITNTFYNGIYCESQEVSNNINIDNTNISGIMANSGLKLMSSGVLENISITSDSIHSSSGGGPAVSIYSNNIVNNVNVVDCFLINDTINGSGHGLSISCNNQINEVTINNSTVTSRSNAAEMSSTGNINNVTVDNSTFIANSGDGIRIFSDLGLATNINLGHSDFRSIQSYGIDASIENINGLNINHSNIESVNNVALLVESTNGCQNLNITTNNVYANSSSIRIFNYFDNLDNVHVDSNFINSYDGIECTGANSSISSNLTFNNNTINTTSYDAGIEIDFDQTGVDGMEVNNNSITSAYGIWVESNQAGLNNVDLLNNSIKVNYEFGRGVILENPGINVNVKHNTIDTIACNITYDTYSAGILVYCQSPPLIQSINIDSNDIYNTANNAVNVDGASNVNIRDNHISTLSGYSGSVIIAENIQDGHLNITGNHLYCTGAPYGIVGYAFNGTSANRPLIANNLISGTSIAVYLEEFPYGILANNSISTSENNDPMIIFEYGSHGTDFMNNIINVDSSNYAAPALIAVFDLNDMNIIRNNVYNIDTISTRLYYDDYTGNSYTSIYEFNVATGKEQGSFYRDVAFVNDTTNLHVLCSETALNAGFSTSFVTSDVDGNARAAIPTIGGDEILSTNNIFANSTQYICGNSLTLDAGYAYNSTYSWSTGATTQSITVNAAGNYSVTITSPCGVVTDVVNVQYLSSPTASFGTNTSFLTGIFTNTSTNANSYLWNFGDGNTSTATSPTHVYATGNSYTVTLIAYGDCTNDTTTFLVTVSTIGLEEVSNINFNMYPNPTDGVFYINLDNINAERLEISIINIQGQSMFSSEFNQITGPVIQQMNIENYPPGIYFVRIQADQQTLTGRIIRQ